MLLANMATARHVYSRFPELALLRCHPPPKAKMVDELQELCHQLGLDIDLSSAGTLHVSRPPLGEGVSRHSKHFPKRLFFLNLCFFRFPNVQMSLNGIVGDDEYSAARKEVLTHMCSRPMQVSARRRRRLPVNTAREEEVPPVTVFCPPHPPRWLSISAAVPSSRSSSSSTTPSTSPSTRTSPRPSGDTPTSSSTGCWRRLSVWTSADRLLFLSPFRPSLATNDLFSPSPSGGRRLRTQLEAVNGRRSEIGVALQRQEDVVQESPGAQ